MLRVLKSECLWFTGILVGLELAQLDFEIFDHLAVAACIVLDSQVLLEFNASDVCCSELSEFDPGLAVVLDEVASDVGAALFAADLNTVVPAFLQEIEPDNGGAGVGTERVNLDTILVLVLDCVVDNLGVIGADLNADLVLVEGVANYLRTIVRKEEDLPLRQLRCSW